ncbi:transmembrane protein, putative (macronuclear) [Tetrahymena thermophila SB210]|uniref:Transmembrane protein, putative n=1 Tax=Tetrahymena thermophila (strain SB210) TaxID=312017 RepID=Q23RH1_TETTS|nr:transmembrane protein, putative [Tetrahymena thermophila SB210]EAR99077.2 transmembrane protein, putative [Tetrahymena thermophila SB210]|eukprot:XP_001019322.2 transmembrane protein, putative [Tetrahymena thermophila SB210]
MNQSQRGNQNDNFFAAGYQMHSVYSNRGEPIKPSQFLNPRQDFQQNTNERQQSRISQQSHQQQQQSQQQQSQQQQQQPQQGSKLYEEQLEQKDEEIQKQQKSRRNIISEITIIMLAFILELVSIAGYIIFSIFKMFAYAYLLFKGQSDILSDLLDPILTIFFSIANISNSLIQFRPQNSNCVFDINNNSLSWREEYKRIIEMYEVDLKCQLFNTFFNLDDNPSTYEWRGYCLFLDMNQQLKPLKIQFILLLCVSLMKIGFTILYVVKKEKQYGINEIFNIIVLFFFYINFCYSLNRVLSNYDLRRKRLMIRNLNRMIKMSGDIVQYFEKLDITSAISLETWDNCRRCVYDFFKQEQKKLEACYICLFFYFIFVALACASFYANFYIFFEKDSIHLHPLMIICYSMDFVLFSIIIFMRLYQGQLFNDSFEKSEHRIDSLEGLIQDLAQMYDYYFGKKHINENSLEQLITQQEIYRKQMEVRDPIEKSMMPQGIEDEDDDEQEEDEKNKDQQNSLDQIAQKLEEGMSTTYDILVGKLKYSSRFYILKKKEFLGSRYTLEAEKMLQQKMMQNMLQSYIRIKAQTVSDQKTQQYKFLNYFNIRFEQTLITTLVGLGTVLPSILKNFFDMFH